MSSTADRQHKKNYFRFQIDLDDQFDAMDDTQDATLSYLENKVSQLLQRETFTDLVERLKELMAQEPPPSDHSIVKKPGMRSRLRINRNVASRATSS